MAMSGDRTSFVPPHRGDNVLPNTPLFHRLLRLASRSPPPIAIRDIRGGIEKTYLQLLSDVLSVRKGLLELLDVKIRHQLEEDTETYIALIAPGSYAYTVGFFAILAAGAAVVPIAVKLPAAETSYYLRKARCVAILASNDTSNLASPTAKIPLPGPESQIPQLSITTRLNSSDFITQDIVLSAGQFSNPNQAGLVIFTSGTTGPPKGVVQRRGQLLENAELVADHYRITDQDVVQHMLPVHHATGIGITQLPFLVSGACVEFRSSSFDAAWTWERWRQGGLTVFSGVPTLYSRLKQHFEDVIALLPPQEQASYIQGARKLRILLCGTSALPGPVQQFWTELMGGRPVLTRYGATEIGSIFKVDLNPVGTPANSVGRLEPGVSAKISGEGLLMVKGPYMFSKYLFDEKETATSHDPEGFFQTGDVVRKEGPYYTILGRASVDIIKSGGYKISALDIEREILGLEYISEVMVVGVPDEEFGERVAAVVCLSAKHRDKRLTLDTLRADLRSHLAGYKMPTLLRILSEELPKSATGKVQKKILGPRFFHKDYHSDPEVQMWRKSSRARI
ncbi:hypothetical protein N7447_009353 [Penicillium robsamsonii]|uniref:uncharacterized protein n=1 Tax=Penicillium robsamsonii TaxID=1792511 RepID=UPI002546C588|nr:uncharacterized protein N7447_009353 [Penicillium robsamsonii]KAJ5817120.1 hypothetical protein N7447_009353 [Penicillium robsamsonii]